MYKAGGLIIFPVFLFLLASAVQVQSSHFTSSTCPSPYHVITSDDRCVWSCGTGTTPDTASNECVCQSGYTQTGTDSFGRRTCTQQTTDSPPVITTSLTPSTQYVGLPLTLTASATDDKSIASLSWSAPGNTGSASANSCSQTTCSFSVSLPTFGTGAYTVTVTSTDNLGQSSKYTLSSNIVSCASNSDCGTGNACASGKCSIIVSPSPTPSPSPQNLTVSTTCTDSDNGLNVNTKGTVTGIYAGASPGYHAIYGQEPNPNTPKSTTNQYSTYYDHCSWDPSQLNEGFCDSNNKLQSYGYKCPNGCKDGACISSSPIPTPTPSQTTPGAGAPEPPNDEPGTWAQVETATNQIVDISICTKSVCGLNGEYHGYVPPASYSTGSVWWPTSKRYIWQLQGQAGYSSGTFNFNTYTFTVAGGTIYNGQFTPTGTSTTNQTTSISPSPTPYTTSYPEETYAHEPARQSASCSRDQDCLWIITNGCPEAAGAAWACGSLLASMPKNPAICPQILSRRPAHNCGCIQNACVVYEKEKPREPPKKIEGTEIDTTDLLAVVIQLEQLKVKFEYLKSAISKLSNYYNSTGNQDSASRWQRASQILQEGIDKIESLKDEIRDKISDFQKEDLRKVKKDIKSVIDLIKKIVKILLEKPEITPTPSPSSLPEPTNQSQDQQAPDLKINSCTIIPPNPRESANTQIILQVENKGSRDANFPGGASTLRVQNYGGGYSPACRNVPAGQTVNCSISWNAFDWPAGAYNPTMIIDPDNRIGESNEDNNQFTCPVTLIQETSFADLVITNIELTEATPTLQNDFKVKVTVTNLGSVNATITYPSLVVSSTYIEYVYPPYNSRWTLTPGSSITFEKSPNAGYLREGTQNWAFTVDPDGQVTESNESNNVYTKEVTIFPAGPVSGPAPDLRISSCSVIPQSPKDSDRTQVVIQVQNTGDRNATFPGGSSKLNVRNYGGGYSPICYNVLAGQTVNCSISWDPFGWPAGTHNPRFIIDPDNRVGESNESNNEFTCPVTLAQETNFADLVITSVELTESRPTLQNDFKIRTTVQNQGTVNATIRYPSLVVSSTYMEYVYPPYNGQWTLAPGSSATFEKNPNAGYLREGTQSWTFTVDPGGQVRESNENNNIFNKTVTIFPP